MSTVSIELLRMEDRHGIAAVTEDADLLDALVNISADDEVLEEMVLGNPHVRAETLWELFETIPHTVCLLAGNEVFLREVAEEHPRLWRLLAANEHIPRDVAEKLLEAEDFSVRWRVLETLEEQAPKQSADGVFGLV